MKIIILLIIFLYASIITLIDPFSLEGADKHFGTIKSPKKQTEKSQTKQESGISLKGLDSSETGVDRLRSLEEENEDLELEIEAESPQQDDLLYQVQPELLEGGKNVNISFYQANVKDVIRTISKKAKISIVISPLVEGEVISQLYKIPVKIALRNILSAHKLYYIPDNGVLQIVTEEEYRIFAQKKLTQTKVFDIRWSSLRKAVLAARPYLTRGLGKITVNSRTSRIVITDLPNRLKQIETIIKKIEVENKQILINVKIIEIEYSDEKNVGAFYTITEQNNQQTFLGARFQSSRAPISNQQGGLRISATIDDIPFPNSNALKSIQLGLSAVGVSGEATIVSSPRILVEENSKASVHIGQEIPYPTSTTSSTGVIQSSFNFLQAGTKLIIVPKITDFKKKKMRLKIDIESSTAQLISFNEEGTLQAPQKNITRTRLTANCRHGQTLVIAGFVNYIQIDDTVGIPLLKDIPFINFFFATTAKKLQRREIAILITARILDKRGTPVKKIYRQLSGQSEN